MSTSNTINSDTITDKESVWEEQAIDALCLRVTSGGTPLRKISSYYENGSVPWFKTKELKDWYLDDSEEKITVEALENSSAKLFPSNTVLMAMYGDGRTITSLGILRREGATNQACCAMIVNPELCDSLFLLYSLKFHRNEFIHLASGGAQRNLNAKTIREFKIGVPPLPIQRKIAAILSAYDDLIENNTRRIKILEEMAQAIYREWFVHFRFPGHENVRLVDSGTELGEVPEGWEVRKLSELVETQYGYTESAKDEPVGPKFVRGKDINKTTFIIWDEVPYCPIGEDDYQKYRLEPGDVLIIRMADPGKVGIIEKTIESVFASYLIRLKIISKKMSPYFLFYTLLGEHYQGYITGASTGTTRKSASAPVITDYNLALPPDNIHNKFENTIYSIRKMMNVLLEKNSNLRTTRDLLLPKLVSGQIDVCELSVE